MKLLTLIFITASLASTSLADDTPAEPLDHFGRLLALLDTAAEHHIEAPARQQLALTVARAFYKAGDFQPPGNLAEQISKLATEAEYKPFLRAILDKHPNQKDKDWACRFAANSLIDSLPGECFAIPAKEYAVQDSIAASRYVGVGIALSADGEGTPTISKVFPGGPISKVGSRDGDQIWAVDGIDVREKKLPEVIDLLRGPRFSMVELVLKPRQGNPRKVEVKRDVVPMKAVRELRILEGGRIGIVSIDQLRASVAHELRSLEAVIAEKGIQGLIIDLRATQEGRAHDVKLLADALLPGGVIGSIDDGGGEPEIFRAGEEAIFKGLELAVLVDRSTVGVVEWLAASLQHNQRAVVVGNLTSGQPYAMEGFEIEDTDLVLRVPSGMLGIGEGESLVHWRALEDRKASDRPMPWKAAAGKRWGIEPDVWIGGEFIQEALRAGMGQSEVFIQQAKDELERRVMRTAI